MTLRARPVARRRGRAGWDPGDRRNSLINLGFFLAIGISLLILLGYAGWSWYDAHFGAAATVNGQVITKDHVINRLKIESFRLDYIERRIQTLLAKGRMSAADAQSQIDRLNQVRQQLTGIAVERLVDVALQAKLAADNGISVDEAEVDKQFRTEATTSEQRHVWMIEIEPVPNEETGEIGQKEKQAALTRALQALARLQRGESWEDVARTASDSGLAPQAGDLGWLSEESGYDKAFMEAVFAAELNAPTEAIEGDDDIYRIGRATEVAAEEVDEAFNVEIEEADITLADYRVAARADALRLKLSDKIVADMSQPSVQRHVLEIHLPEPNAPASAAETGVKVRHILYAPKDDADKADELPADDPAWAAAKAEADAAVAALKRDPKRFDAMARAESDEPSARGIKGTGGKQPWYYPTSGLDPAFKDAIFKPGLTPGQLLDPVKSAFGWHVIEFLRPTGDGEKAWLELLVPKATNETTFKQLAKDNSEGEEAGQGGDIGWVAKGQLVDQLETAVFGAAIGANTGVITISGDGDYLLRVLGEETRAPTEEQIAIFENSGFQYWYTAQKEAADVDYLLPTTEATG